MTQNTGTLKVHPASGMFRAHVCLAIILFGPFLFACGPAEPPALAIGLVRFSSTDVGLLSASQRTLLAGITTFGVLTSRAELDRLARLLTRRQTNDLLVRRLGLALAFEAADVDPSELRQRYRTQPDYELEARHILFRSERWRPDQHRAEAGSAAADIARLARARPDRFAEIAAEFSQEPGAARRGGLLEPAREGDWVENFWRAAAALEEGEISGVIESRYGFHIIKLLERRPVPFDQARGQVQRRLVRDPDVLRAARTYSDSLLDLPGDTLSRRAVELGLGVSDEKREEVFQEKLARMRRLAETFGFTGNMDVEQLRRGALAALGATAQQAILARRRIAGLVPVLRGFYTWSGSALPASSSDTGNIAVRS